MGRRSLDVVDLTELFVHWEAGRSQVQIGESLGLDRKTVRKYLAPALSEGLVPGGPAAGEAVWARRIAGWFPELSDARVRQVTWPAIEAHRDYIVEQLKDGVTVSTISARLIAEKGLTASGPRCGGGSWRTWPNTPPGVGRRCRGVRWSRAVRRRSTTAGSGPGRTRQPAPSTPSGRS